jgi:hypothetical protein
VPLTCPKPNVTDYAADVLLEGLEGQFEEPQPEAAAPRRIGGDRSAADLTARVFGIVGSQNYRMDGAQLASC